MRRQTSVVKVDPSNPEREAIARAAEIIKAGGLVAFPTETVYGLGADALNPEAVKGIFVAKGRPLDNPIIVHVAELEHLGILADSIMAGAVALAERFWPGPLTLILKKSAGIPDNVTAGRETVAVRMPRNNVALALIRACGVPIAAPSANLSGRPSGTTGAHVFQDLAGKIDLVLDAGPVEIGVESTVLDISTRPPTILRPGAVTAEELEGILGQVVLGKQGELLRRSPGTRYRHYSPKARVTLVKEKDRETVDRLVEKCRNRGRRVGIITRRPDFRQSSEGVIVKVMPRELGEYARHMFAVIRELDGEGVDEIIVEEVEERGIGTAIMDRLRKAAWGK
ncbi:MAG: threonylcarbamoyl-AMP synthase [Dehalococcoidia bacterium]|nr:threonylcarbamoyl-AMP synthase [Dehalococcoidia bacterium]